MRVKIKYRNVEQVVILKNIHKEQGGNGECWLIISHAYDTECAEMTNREADSFINQVLTEGFFDATPYEWQSYSRI